jgi:hypothetical protein
MRKALRLAALAILAPAVAEAKIGLAARAGLALPAGDAYEDARTGVRTSMSSLWSSAYPLQLDVAYRVRPGVGVGAYISYAAAEVGGDVRSTCDAIAFSCSARTVRVGIGGFRRLAELRPRFFLWLGAGIGWEWTRFEVNVPGRSFEARFNGVELLGLQAGVEYQASPHFSIGPYVMASFGLYTSVVSDESGLSPLREPIHRTVHEWISIGVRGRYEP